MKLYAVQYNLNTMVSVSSFMNIISEIHHLDSYVYNIEKHIQIFDDLEVVTYLQDKSVLFTYYDVDATYKYIYHYAEPYGVYICVDTNKIDVDYKDYKQCITYLLKNHLIKDDIDLEINDCIKEYNSYDFLYKQKYSLPIVFVPNKDIGNKFNSLNEIVHIIENKTLDTIEVIYSFNNNRTYLIGKNENKTVQSIIQDILHFILNKHLDYMYDERILEEKYLDFINQSNLNISQELMEALELELASVEEEIKQLEENITEEKNQKLLLNSSIESYTEMCNGTYGILRKGNEKEFYAFEQKDMIYAILEDTLENGNLSKEDKEIVEDILKLNTYEGKRVEYLGALENYLKSVEKFTVADKTFIEKYGIKEQDGYNHDKYLYYDDPRYTLTVSTTSSKPNNGRRTYRNIRNLFF